jgi:hypothetical protein
MGKESILSCFEKKIEKIDLSLKSLMRTLTRNRLGGSEGGV